MKKILVIGCPGAGKSTFARRLREQTGLPLFYLDRIWHKPDKTTVSREEFDAALGAILAQDRWIIDGNYSRTLERRMKACDTVYFLDLPAEECLAGAMARVGKPREDLPWTEAALDPELEQKILDFSKVERPRIYALLEQYKEKKIVIFRSRKEAE